MNLEKYKMNLRVEKDEIYSYNTLVAKIDFENEQVIVDTTCRSSVTTSKHINYVAAELGFEVIK